VRTRFTDLVGCKLPFQLAALGGVGTIELARAVEQAGGLGMVPGWVSVPEPRSGNIGKGWLIPYLPPLEEVTAAARGLRVAEFFWGEPTFELVQAGHSAGALVSWQTGSAEEARAAEAAGCDMVVIQGIEAGGHVRGTGPLDELLPEVLHAVSLPVIAAGGIATADRVAQLIAAGADAVRVGTRFLACPECDTSPIYVEELMRSRAEDTVLTNHFDDEGKWPAPVRVLRVALEGALAIGNRSTAPPARTAEKPLTMACYAGMGVEHVRAIQPASEIVQELSAELAHT
jgi:NAD(P)H-dependent flavin oxidoreductase YrpB (nitropropane dioxygenase family)